MATAPGSDVYLSYNRADAQDRPGAGTSPRQRGHRRLPRPTGPPTCADWQESYVGDLDSGIRGGARRTDRRPGQLQEINAATRAGGFYRLQFAAVLLESPRTFLQPDC